MGIPVVIDTVDGTASMAHRRYLIV
ncbi:hypothetical protein ABIB34_004429 [Rhodococcus sp. UYP5]